MKKIIFAVLAFASFSFGVSLMNYEFFDKQDNIDIVLSFDSAYKPDITRREGENLVIVLKGVTSEEKSTISINSPILSEFEIVPHPNATHVIFINGAKLNIEAVQKDKLSLTLRVSDPNQKPISLTQNENGEKEKTNFMPFIMILCVLVLLVLVYFLTKKFARKKPKKSVDDTWDAFENIDNNATMAKFDEVKDESVAFKSNEKFEIFDDLNLDKKEAKLNEFEYEEDISYDEPELLNEKTQEKFEENDDKSRKISKILEEESNDNEKFGDEIKVISTTKIDTDKLAVVLKHGEKTHLVVLKNSNMIS
ncbi:MAG: hypothetical protein J6U11_04615 [Campylobacter sp.]|nr:hypothetical protein [Campylobacter sp.]